MLTQPQVQRYAVESRLRDIMIAEKEVVLTFLLHLLSERGILKGWRSRAAPVCGKCLSAARGDSRPIWISRASSNTITRMSSSK
ncbi:MAG: hypothetical protein WB869_05920 [Candidatus Acidiferrales bacterium]